MVTNDGQGLLSEGVADELEAGAIDDIQDAKAGVESLFDLLGRAHALDVLLAVVHATEPIRFNELEALVDIPSATLSKRLQELTTAGFVSRESHDEIPPRVEYEVTGKTMALKPVFFDMLAWADTHSLSD